MGLGGIDKKKKKEGEKLGLYDGHAYSVLGAHYIKTLDNKTIRLVKVRNPHKKNEWTGPWSDYYTGWDNVSEETKKLIGFTISEDG